MIKNKTSKQSEYEGLSYYSSLNYKEFKKLKELTRFFRKAEKTHDVVFDDKIIEELIDNILDKCDYEHQWVFREYMEQIVDEIKQEIESRIKQQEK